MGSRHTDQFPFIITSDGSMDVFPTNKSSSFKVALEKPLDFGESDWEVALEYINYPYTWTNVGPSAGTLMKVYYDHVKGPHEISFPDWHCDNMEKLLQYIQTRIDEQIGTDCISIGLDSLDRFKIMGNSPTFDVGFSWSLLKLLGLAGHELAKHMTIEAFERRQHYRGFLDKIWIAADNDFRVFGSYELRKIVMDTVAERSYASFEKAVIEHIDITQLNDIVRQLEIEGDGEILKTESWNNIFLPMLKRRLSSPMNFANDENIVRLNDPNSDADLILRGLFLVWFHLYELYSMRMLPAQIKGATPGNLNPVERMFVYTNIIEPIDFNNGHRRLLKMVNTRGVPFKTTHEEFVKPSYLRVEKGKISVIEVYITDMSGKPVSFQIGTLMLMLHFRKLRNSQRIF